jgi:ferredoxin-NADP reductase
LTRQYVDRFVDRGEADLVDEMLWEVPLTIALHFLGVPEEEMATLRKYSIAHTVNTWGRPTHDEQLAVAESVGRFWEFAGQVLEKMRADPDGHGWMHYAIRRQREMPDVITDSYLHSMMMAGIVAAHETTAHASANALRMLLEHRDVWDEICACPALIPNAVEECLRLWGSIVAWRRIATADTRVGDVAIPAGSRLLVVMASANHDGRYFEDPDVLDIHRDNSADHLSFGYGSHQCMGRNLARMEMRIFLEEFTQRLPHMELAPDQHYSYLPNISFRGPEHLRVRWDPALNPERRDPRLLDRHVSFPIGAPSREALGRTVRIAEATHIADGVLRLTLEDPQGRTLPAWTAGSHIHLLVGGYVRKYSLCGDPTDTRRLQIAVQCETKGRGGSLYIHRTAAADTQIRVRGPKNNFRLNEDGSRYLLIAGGIGITPIIAMADRLKALGKTYVVHFAGRTRASMAFLDRLARDHCDNVRLHVSQEGSRLDLAQLVAGAPQDTEIYACGPARMLEQLERLTGVRPERLHFEHFSSGGPHDASSFESFEVVMQHSGTSVLVGATETLLQALRRTGVDVPSDCEEGLCGTCEVRVLAGEIDHRDKVLSAAERAGGQRVIACCSRARGKHLVLAL